MSAPLRRRTLALAVLAALAPALLAACGDSGSEDTSPVAQATSLDPSGSTSPSSADPADPADLVPLSIGGPWAGAPGKAPVLTGPLGYAIAEGKAEPILQQYGFTFAGFVAFNNGPPAAQAVESGDIEAAVIGDTPAVLSRAGGLDNRAVVVARPTSDIWFLAKPGGVTALADLKGKKVGLQFGSNFDKYGRAVLEQAGVLADVELVNILFADALPALQRGDIDAYPVPATTAGLWQSQVDLPVITKASVDDPDLLATTVTLVKGSFLEENPELAQALWEATQAGQQLIEADHRAYAQFESDSTGAPVAVIEAGNLWQYSTEPIDPDGLKAVQSTLDFLTTSGAAASSVDLDVWVQP